MAAIWNEIEIQWLGESYKIRPSIEFINHLEQRKGHTLPNLVLQLTNGNLGAATCSLIIADALNYAGVEVSADDVFQEFSGVSREIFDCAYIIVASCLPQPRVVESAGDVKKKTTRRKAAKTKP